MDDWIRPVTLEGAFVRLEPLSRGHLDGLAEVAFDPAIWRWMPIRVERRSDLEALIDSALDAASTGSQLPFATIDRSSGRPIGSTRFLALTPADRRLEIGWTWVVPSSQRSGANREAKLLMLEHAFERLGANRVEFKTDSLNARSREALLGIGATFEGVLRDHMVMPDGRLRHSAYYSIVASEWPLVRVRLRAGLRR